MDPIWEFLGRKVERSWLVPAFVVGVLTSPLLVRAGRWMFEFLTADGSEGSGPMSLRPLVWLLLIASLLANWWLVRQVLRLRDNNEELTAAVERWQALAPKTPAPPTSAAPPE